MTSQDDLQRRVKEATLALGEFADSVIIVASLHDSEEGVTYNAYMSCGNMFAVQGSLASYMEKTEIQQQVKWSNEVDGKD
jgi:hypothetical protein